jgi:hypothetical protein
MDHLKSITGWQEMYRAACDYAKAIEKATDHTSVFSPETTRNICSLALEKFFMAFFMHRGMLPQNHRMTDLLITAEEFLSISRETKAALLKIDNQMDLCSLDNVSITPPPATDIPEFVAAVFEVKNLVSGALNQ